jgi:putative addiction module killer protein
MFLVPRKIVYYVSRNGKKPFAEWLNALDSVTKEFVYERLEKVKVGYFGDCKNLGSGVFELRIHLGAGYRIYYGIDGREIILLLCAGDKGSQDKDIKKAKFFLEEYRNAKKD